MPFKEELDETRNESRNPLKAGQVIPTPYCQRASVSMFPETVSANPIFFNLIFLYHKTSTLSNPFSFNQFLFPQNPPIFSTKTHLRFYLTYF